MKTKIVYVLTSDESDYYLEQTLMSVYSARRYNPQAHITLVTDQFTRESCKSGLRSDFLAYFDEVVVVDTSEYDRKVLRSRQLKTTLREHVSGDFLYIDCDTVVCESLDAIDHQQGLIAAVLDSHLNKADWSLFWDGQEKAEAEFFGAANVGKRFNGGVSYVKDVPETHEFYRLWNEEWRKNLERTGIYYDQPPLHTAIKELNFEIEELDGTWNCQISSNYLPFLAKAKIMHCIYSAACNASPCIFRDKALFEEIRQNDGLTDHIRELIESPRTAFTPINIVYERQAALALRQKIIARIVLLYNEHRIAYRMLDLFSRLLTGPFVIIRKTKRMLHL